MQATLFAGYLSIATRFDSGVCSDFEQCRASGSKVLAVKSGLGPSREKKFRQSTIFMLLPALSSRTDCVLFAVRQRRGMAVVGGRIVCSRAGAS